MLEALGRAHQTRYTGHTIPYRWFSCIFTPLLTRSIPLLHAACCAPSTLDTARQLRPSRVKFYRSAGLDKTTTFLPLLRQLRTCLGVADRFTLSASFCREQLQQFAACDVSKQTFD